MLRMPFVRRSKAKDPFSADIELLRKSPLLDLVWYRECNPDLRDVPLDVARHYLEHGAREGRNPHPLFNTRFYLDRNPDVAASGMNPLVHYILHGAREGRSFSPFIDPIWYRETYADLRGTAIDVACHYLEKGGQEGRNPQPSFDTKLYLEQNPDVAASGMNPLVHYVVHGKKEGRPWPLQRVVGQPSEPTIKPPQLFGREVNDSAHWLQTTQIVSAVRSLAKKNIGASDLLSVDVTPGIGSVPRRTITRHDLPVHSLPILQRYENGRLETTRRFELDPSRAGAVVDGPTISILMPAYRTPIVYLERAILSVLFQTYSNWELLIVDNGSRDETFAAILKYYAGADKRITVSTLDQNIGISGATNIALSMAEGPYVGLLDSDDMLTRNALEKVASRLLEDDALDLVYSDECTIDTSDVVDWIFHKPDWSPLLLLNFMYTGHFSVYRRELVEKVGRFRSEYDYSQDYDLALRVAEQTSKVAHIEECLYGWRMIPGSGSVGDKPDARISNIGALQSAADRRGWGGVAIALPTANRLRRQPPSPRPLVSIVVPSAGKLKRLKETVESIKSLTTYENYEVVFITGSPVIAQYGGMFSSENVRFVPYDKPFNFSEKCNVGAAHANGEYVIFYNDDVVVISPDWIESILECLTLPGVGAVGPKLIYENGTIQHAGMVTGARRLVGTAFHSYPAQTTAYFNMAQSVREISIICGACLAMPMSLFQKIGGWDERNTPSAHSDIDLCFRIRQAGYSCVYTPHAELVHIGHVEIGADEAVAKKAKAFKKDKADIFLLKRWGEYCERDPYFPKELRDLVYIDSQETFQYFSTDRAVSGGGPDVLIFSNDLSGSGAPRVVFDIALALIKLGCFVLVMSPEDGVFRHRLLDIGAHVIVDPLALSGHDTVVDLGKNFDIVIANTAVSWRAVKQLSPFAPVYWYLHETEYVGHLANQYPDFLDSFGCAAAVWAGSAFCADYVRRYGVDARIIEYGVDDTRQAAGLQRKAAGRSEILISVLATYEPRKGQDLALKGYLAMPDSRRRRFRLRFAGRTNDRPFREAVEQIALESDASEFVEFQGELDYAAYRARLEEADIVICPSRDDTLPLVSLNALAEGKIFICSRETGTSRYIEEGVSGFVLERNHPDDIAATLTKVADRIGDWPMIGRAAREVFLNNFTHERFRERLFDALSLGPRAAVERSALTAVDA